jgi:DNA mismatch repair protein MutL
MAIARNQTGSEGAGRTDALRERLRALHSDQHRLLPVDYLESSVDGETSSNLAKADSDFHIWGFIGAPGVSRSTREEQHLFVNRRPVENRGLNFALLEGYHTALMKGRYPVCCLFLEINPAQSMSISTLQNGRLNFIRKAKSADLSRGP